MEVILTNQQACNMCCAGPGSARKPGLGLGLGRPRALKIVSRARWGGLGPGPARPGFSPGFWHVVASKYDKESQENASKGFQKPRAFGLGSGFRKLRPGPDSGLQDGLGSARPGSQRARPARLGLESPARHNTNPENSRLAKLVYVAGSDMLRRSESPGICMLRAGTFSSVPVFDVAFARQAETAWERAEPHVGMEAEKMRRRRWTCKCPKSEVWVTQGYKGWSDCSKKGIILLHLSSTFRFLSTSAILVV
ncbi:hypothetical protein CERSUDRAFT_76649 [Gelatoporia subvermispora B]|uniref:Uncharacterized protein n=1 Tax=Ceriporiopsis subvermispora (strain B) TaxID=914234 RepID=M2Q9A2_CERS8|nr:hypothetical protein CERSUDRAFT_76649 [Gelatoporia subvermispora B]